MGLVEPIGEGVRYVINLVNVLLGGIFGLYLILVIMRWIEARQLVRLLKEINENIKNLNNALGAEVFERKRALGGLKKSITSQKKRKKKEGK